MTDTPATAPEDDAIAALSFEQALAQLEQIVAQLESGQAELERSIALYERGAKLKAHCEARLRQAQLRVEKIVVGRDGAAASSQPADFDR
jgi:exodeoxyribonuclease VII small subunit